MNYGEVIARLTTLEQKVEKLSPSINVGTPTSGAEVAGITSALGVQLIGLTTAQRTALGVRLSQLSDVRHILVFDTEDKTFYAWDGTIWT